MVDSWEDELEFEALMNEGAGVRPTIELHPGDEVVGRVLHVGEDTAQLDIDGIDGMLDVSHLGAADRPVVGDKVRCYVVRARGKLVEVSSSIGRARAAKMALHTAHETGLPVEGRVVETNKGGYVVEIGGNRAFCPHSLMDLMRVEDPEALVGATLMFKVTELRDGRDATVSRRAVLQAEKDARAAETLDRLVVGARFRGRVTSIRDFGFFVDIGGLDGLVHLSELPYGHKRPHEVVSPGQAVEVEVVGIEPATAEREMRIGLSMKALAADPFEAAVDELPAGTVLRGVVQRLESYGAFVEIATGIEGLLHISAFGRRIPSVRSVLDVGDEIIVRIKELDPALRRVSLALVEPEDLADVLEEGSGDFPNSLGARTLGQARDKDNPDIRGEAGTASPAERRPPPAPGTILEVVVDKHLRFGVIVRWPETIASPGEGMIATLELGVPYGTDLRREFPTGKRMLAVVIEVRADGRVRLSRKRVEENRERAEAAAFMAKQAAEQRGRSGDGEIGSFGELLKEKLGL